MPTSMTVSEARAALPRVLDLVLAGEEVTITRHGTPVAVVVRPDSLRARRAEQALGAAARVQDVIDRGRRAPLSARPTLTEERADDLVDEVRTSRSRR